MPAGLTVTADPHALTVSLRWTPPADNKGVVSYRVYRDGTAVADLAGCERGLRLGAFGFPLLLCCHFVGKDYLAFILIDLDDLKRDLLADILIQVVFKTARADM